MILMGHRTFDLMASFWPSEEGKRADPGTSQFMSETPKVVVTHTPFVTLWENTKIISSDIEGEVVKLKAQAGKDIAIFGSNTLCVSLMEKGLVDEFRIMVNPLALGEGTILFKGLSKKIAFTLTATRRFKSGNILNTYIPA